MKYVCSVCGYVHEGDAAPEKCPICGVPAEKFTAQSGEKTWAAEHVVGVAKGVPQDIIDESESRGHVKLQGGKGESSRLRFFFLKSIGIFVNSPEEYQSN